MKMTIAMNFKRSLSVLLMKINECKVKNYKMTTLSKASSGFSELLTFRHFLLALKHGYCSGLFV